MDIRNWINAPADQIAETDDNSATATATAAEGAVASAPARVPTRTSDKEDRNNPDAAYAEGTAKPLPTHPTYPPHPLSPPNVIAAPEIRPALDEAVAPTIPHHYEPSQPRSGVPSMPSIASESSSSSAAAHHPRRPASDNPHHDSAASTSRSASGSGSGSGSGAAAGYAGGGEGGVGGSGELGGGLHAVSSQRDLSDNASLNAPSSFSVGLSIDTDSSDADSALGSVRAQSSSVSASSSIFDFVEEHGRTWHRYHEGKYFMPNDIPEQERLDLQHSISVRLFGGLYLAPIDHPNRVLDLGTGTGIWAIEFANEHPESDVLGTDLSPIQPEYVPPNCRFEVDDAEDEWVFGSRFDLIHARFMCGSFSNFPAIFASCLDNLNPGGWIEFQDYYVKVQAMDDSLAGTALERWNDLVLEGVRRMGKNGLAAARFKGQMLDAGFVDVVERKYALPGNPWAKGEDQKMLGMMQMENILDGLHGMSIGLFTKMLGMSAEEVELMLVDVRKDMRNTKIHFYYIV